MTFIHWVGLIGATLLTAGVAFLIARALGLIKRTVTPAVPAVPAVGTTPAQAAIPAVKEPLLPPIIRWVIGIAIAVFVFFPTFWFGVVDAAAQAFQGQPAANAKAVVTDPVIAALAKNSDTQTQILGKLTDGQIVQGKQIVDLSTTVNNLPATFTAQNAQVVSTVTTNFDGKIKDLNDKMDQLIPTATPPPTATPDCKALGGKPRGEVTHDEGVFCGWEGPAQASPTPTVTNTPNPPSATPTLGGGPNGQIVNPPTALPAAGNPVIDPAQTGGQPTNPAPEPTVSLNLGDVKVVFKGADSLDYGMLERPDPNRQQKFPDVPYGQRPALAEYVPSSANWDFFQTDKGHLFLAQYHYRIISAGEFDFPAIGVSCKSSKNKGCALILVNHYGDTADLKYGVAVNGFTVSGRVWDMASPTKTNLAAQALLENTLWNMLVTDGKNQGANCSTIDGCKSVEWHVIYVAEGEKQMHWAGLTSR